MKIVDANVLLYAVNEDAPHHEHSKQWLDSALGGGDTVCLAWVAMLAFLRIGTHSSIFDRPLSVEDACSQLDRWLSSPHARVVEPGPGHLAILTGLLGTVGVGANLVNDAHLAALAIESRADLVTYDNDFSRFPGVAWQTPSLLLRDRD